MTLPFDEALRRQHRLALVVAVTFGVVTALWCVLFLCEIVSDLLAPQPLPAPALAIIGGTGVLLAAGFSALATIIVRSAGARHLQRVRAAIRTRRLPAEVDPLEWAPTLRAQADGRRIGVQVLPVAVFSVIGLTHLTHQANLYGTLLWVTYFLALLLGGAGAGFAFLRGRPAAQELLVELESRTSSSAQNPRTASRD